MTSPTNLIDKKPIFNYMNGQRLCTLATTDGQKVEAAVIQFLPTKNLELVFYTRNTYRKVKNLRKNHNVAVVISGEDKKEIQYEGIAVQISKQKFGKYIARYLARYPMSKNIYKKDVLFFMIKPTWVRYYNFKRAPIRILKFASLHLKKRSQVSR
jgi:uncharacterized protein YhbP (UPF0306 family)